jgi:hypothetical protein
VAELSPEELAQLLQKLDNVCRQAQELSAQIRLKMAESKRREYRVPEVNHRDDRPARRRKPADT